jgi:hypothetical protein
VESSHNDASSTASGDGACPLFSLVAEFLAPFPSEESAVVMAGSGDGRFFTFFFPLVARTSFSFSSSDRCAIGESAAASSTVRTGDCMHSSSTGERRSRETYFQAVVGWESRVGGFQLKFLKLIGGNISFPQKLFDQYSCNLKQARFAIPCH